MASHGAAVSCSHNSCATHTQYQCWNYAQTRPWSFINMDRAQVLDYKHSYMQLCKWVNNSGFLPRYSIILSYVRTQLCSGTVWHLCTSALFSSTACKLGKNKVYKKAHRNMTTHGITLSLLSIPLSPAWLSLSVYFLPNTGISRKEEVYQQPAGLAHAHGCQCYASKTVAFWNPGWVSAEACPQPSTAVLAAKMQPRERGSLWESEL